MIAKTVLMGFFLIFSISIQKLSAQTTDSEDYDWKSCAHLQGTYACIHKAEYSRGLRPNQIKIFEQFSSLKLQLSAQPDHLHERVEDIDEDNQAIYTQLMSPPALIGHYETYTINGRMNTLIKGDYYLGKCEKRAISFEQIFLGNNGLDYYKYNVWKISQKELIVTEKYAVEIEYQDDGDNSKITTFPSEIVYSCSKI